MVEGIPTVLLYGREVATYHVTVWKIPIIWLDGREPAMLLYGRDVPTRLLYGRDVPTRLCMVGMYLPSHSVVGMFYHMMGTYIPRLLYGRDVPTRLLYGYLLYQATVW